MDCDDPNAGYCEADVAAAFEAGEVAGCSLGVGLSMLAVLVLILLGVLSC